MAREFVLELRNVSSLTEARFAAGEGFTHIRLSETLASGPEGPIQEIKGFLSGVRIGADLGEGAKQPSWADYTVQNQNFRDKSEELTLVVPDSEGHLEHCIIEIEDLTKDLPQTFGRPAGLSFPSPEEYKVGHADYEPVQELLEKARMQFGI